MLPINKVIVIVYVQIQHSHSQPGIQKKKQFFSQVLSPLRRLLLFKLQPVPSWYTLQKPSYVNHKLTQSVLS